MQELDVKVAEMLNRHPAVGMALGVVRNGSLEFFRGHGVADIPSKAPITEDTVFRVASITKTFTTIAVLQLWEQGRIDLDGSANDHLRAFQLVPAEPGEATATVRQLLTHTSGIPEMVHTTRTLRYIFGESIALGERVPALAEYYRGQLRQVVAPGSRFTYTDHNFATLGQIVDDVTGQTVEHYLREHVFEPLGMGDTDLSRARTAADRRATGYTFGVRGPKAVVDRQWVTRAASSAYSTPRDMARYVAALLGGGANEFGSVLKPSTVAAMFAPQYQPDPRVPGIGLAFSRFTFGGHPVVEHEGILPGFNSDIFLAPEDGVGVMAFTNGARMAMLWLPDEVGRLLGHLIAAPDDTVRTDVPHHPEVWGDICGWYPFTAPLTDMRVRSMLGAGVSVRVRRGQLVLSVLNPIPAAWRGFPLHPDDAEDPHVFRIDLSRFGIGSGRIIFTREAGATRLHFDLLPLSLTRRVGRSVTGARARA